MQNFRLVLCLSFILLAGFSLPALSAGVDLHAHLFMKEGMGWLFRGSFEDPLQATTWEDRFSSQANPITLEKSGLDIIVVALYAHPLFKLSVRDSIRQQIKQARQFTEQHPQWVMARNPLEAREALKKGKHSLVLSLEGAAGVLETEDDLKEFIDEGGIRIVTLLHLTDDEFGGVAFLKGMRSIASPFAFLKSLFHPLHDSQGIRLNRQGLTEDGLRMARRLVQRKVWIDLAHASDASQKDIAPVLAEARAEAKAEGGQPLLYTHTVLRKYLGAERGITFDQLWQVREAGGVVGLMPSEEMLKGTPTEKELCSGSSTPSQSSGGIQALSLQFQEMAEILPESSLHIGSDFNGGIPHLRPSCNTLTSLDQKGLWNIGQTQELWKALSRLGTFKSQQMRPDQTLETVLRKKTETFLTQWERIWRTSLKS